MNKYKIFKCNKCLRLQAANFADKIFGKIRPSFKCPHCDFRNKRGEIVCIEEVEGDHKAMWRLKQLKVEEGQK